MKKGKVEIKKGSCPSCSFGECHVLAYVQNGEIVKVTRDFGSPAGKTCERVTAAVDFHYHPDRVNYPLKRVGENCYNKIEAY